MSRGTVRRGLPPSAGNIPIPADRRFRRSDGRPAKPLTWNAWFKRAGWWAGGGMVVLAVALWAGSALLNAAAFNVSRVAVRGNARVTTPQVLKTLEGILSENILRVDLERYRARLLESPWIGDAELWRVLPSTVQVRIVERTPLAIARLRGQLYLVAADGTVLDAFGPAYQEIDLPIVDGALAPGPNGPVADAERMQLVERLFTELATDEAWFRRVSQVDVSHERNAVLLIDGEPASLIVGDRDFLARLRVYEETKAGLQDQREVKEHYDLRFGNRVWVK